MYPPYIEEEPVDLEEQRQPSFQGASFPGGGAGGGGSGLSRRGAELLSAKYKGFVTRHALSRLWPQIQQMHDVYGMIVDLEAGGQDDRFVDNLYASN